MKMKKNSIIADMWASFRKDDRPDWERMSDDSMNKVLKTVILCIFAYGGYHFIIALIERFSG
ncbi:MAG: hypothetical protein CMC89_00255 [Flavobacteriaceae bacterium]|nr:hypothetical protein [Flavobacteriaceae bacterium]